MFCQGLSHDLHAGAVKSMLARDGLPLSPQEISKDYPGLSIASKGLQLWLTRRQHRFGYPGVVSIRLSDRRTNKTYALSGLEMDLCV